jgi:hypothetical protein
MLGIVCLAAICETVQLFQSFRETKSSKRNSNLLQIQKKSLSFDWLLKISDEGNGKLMCCVIDSSAVVCSFNHAGAVQYHVACFLFLVVGSLV